MMYIELAWSVFSAIICFTLGRVMLHLLTGADNDVVIDNAMLNLKISAVFFFPLGVLLVLRTAMQAMGHKILPVLSSSIELGVKIISALWFVPMKGYFGVTVTEPTTWVLCAVFLGAFYLTIGKQRRINAASTVAG